MTNDQVTPAERRAAVVQLLVGAVVFAAWLTAACVAGRFGASRVQALCFLALAWSGYVLARWPLSHRRPSRFDRIGTRALLVLAVLATIGAVVFLMTFPR